MLHMFPSSSLHRPSLLISGKLWVCFLICTDMKGNPLQCISLSLSHLIMSSNLHFLDLKKNVYNSCSLKKKIGKKSEHGNINFKYVSTEMNTLWLTVWEKIISDFVIVLLQGAKKLTITLINTEISFTAVKTDAHQSQFCFMVISRVFRWAGK